MNVYEDKYLREKVNRIIARQKEVDLYQTRDSGVTWNLIADTDQDASNGKITKGGIKTGLGFRNTSEGWLTGSSHGNNVFLYHTQDGGTSWETQSLDVPAGFTAAGGSATTYPPIFFDDQRGVMPLYLGSPTPGINLVFYLTTDGGKQWIATLPVISRSNRFIWFWADAANGFAAEEGTDILYTTADSGQSWVRIYCKDMQFSELDFISPYIGWAISGGLLFRTQNGGIQWTQVNP